MKNRILAKFFFEKNDEPGVIIAVKFGQKGFWKTDVETVEHATALNELQDITPAEVEAAECCSMFDTWDTFIEQVEGIEERA
jgi:hypothetical protein